MNRQTFIQYISKSDFQRLFITEMGWNNPDATAEFVIAIENENYSFKQIADRNGFQVLTCQLENIPTSSLAKKIDTRLRRYANDYICIFCLPNNDQHHLWVVPVKKVEKRDLVLVEYQTAEQAGFLFERQLGDQLPGAVFGRRTFLCRALLAGGRHEHQRGSEEQIFFHG